MKPTQEEINEAAKKSWETKTNYPIYKKNGINPYAYILGYKSGFNDAISQMQPEWVSVEDRLPENNAHHTVLINGDRNKSQQIFYTGGYDAIHKEWLNPFGDRIEERITHWMPLPQPPTK